MNYDKSTIQEDDISAFLVAPEWSIDLNDSSNKCDIYEETQVASQ